MITYKEVLDAKFHSFINDYIDSLDYSMDDDDNNAEKSLLNSISKSPNFYPSWIRLAGVYHGQSLIYWSLLCYLKACEEKDALNKVNPPLSPDMKMICRNADIEMDGLSRFFKAYDKTITLDEDTLVEMRLELKKNDPVATLIEKIIETKDKRYMVTIGNGRSYDDDDDDDDDERVVGVNQCTPMPIPIIIKLEQPDDVENKDLLRKLKLDISKLNDNINILDANIMKLMIEIKSFKSKYEKPNLFKRIYNRLFKRNKRLVK